MSLCVPPSIANGIYKVVNVQYSTQDADLLWPGGANTTIGGYRNNDSSKRMLWNVTNVLDVAIGQITLTNQEVKTYVSARGDDPYNLTLVGDANVPLVWSATQASAQDTYYLTLMGDVPLAWTLPDGNDRTPIMVQPKANSEQNNQLWKFVPVN